MRATYFSSLEERERALVSLQKIRPHVLAKMRSLLPWLRSRDSSGLSQRWRVVPTGSKGLERTRSASKSNYIGSVSLALVNAQSAPSGFPPAWRAT